MGYGTVFTLLAELQEQYGLPTWGLGLIGGSAFLAGLVAQLTTARFADRGHARRLLRCGLLTGAGGMLLFSVSGSLWGFVAARAMLGFGTGMFSPAARRVLVAAAPARAGEILGRLGSIEVAGFVLGPPIAAVLGGVFHLKAPFLLHGIVLLVCQPAVRRVVEPGVADAAVANRPVRRLLALPRVRAGLLAGAGIQLSLGVFDAMFARYFRDNGASTALVAMTMSAFPFPQIGLAPVCGRLADRVGAARMARRALIVASAVVAAYGLVREVWLLVAVALAEGLVNAALLPSGQASVARAAPIPLLGAGQGLYGAVGALSAGLGAVGSAILYDRIGARMWFVAAGVVLLFSLLSLLADSSHTPIVAEHKLPCLGPEEVGG